MMLDSIHVQWWSLAWASRAVARGPPLDFVRYRTPKKIRNIRPPNFCSTFTSTLEPLFVPSLGLRHQGLFVEDPIGGSLWETFTEALYLKDIFGKAFFVHSCTKKSFVEGFLWAAHTEDPFVGAH